MAPPHLEFFKSFATCQEAIPKTNSSFFLKSHVSGGLPVSFKEGSILPVLRSVEVVSEARSFAVVIAIAW